MTRKTNSRIAGVTFLVYIAAGLTSLAISGRTTSGEGIDTLRDTIRARFLGPAPYDVTRRRWWTPRQ